MEEKSVHPTTQAISKMQQFSFIDLFINLFESALKFSGDKLAKLQEQFHCIYSFCPGSSVGIATDYGLDGSGSNPGSDEIFRTCPDRPWGPPSFL